MNKAARNEQRKLSATYLNGVAIAVLAIGGFTPMAFVVQQLGNNLPAVPSAPVLALIAICFVGSVALHWVARNLLAGMEE